MGDEVVLNADEEMSSPGSTPLLLQCAGRAHAGLSFEPALPLARLAALTMMCLARDGFGRNAG